jgi:hypothetical protein
MVQRVPHPHLVLVPCHLTGAKIHIHVSICCRCCPPLHKRRERLRRHPVASPVRSRTTRTDRQRLQTLRRALRAIPVCLRMLHDDSRCSPNDSRCSPSRSQCSRTSSGNSRILCGCARIRSRCSVNLRGCSATGSGRFRNSFGSSRNRAGSASAPRAFSIDAAAAGFTVAGTRLRRGTQRLVPELRSLEPRAPRLISAALNLRVRAPTRRPRASKPARVLGRWDKAKASCGR